MPGRSVTEGGDPVRIGLGGAEVEGVIVESAAGVLHVRVAKAMRKATGRTVERKAAKKR
jgi:hypothetical protein